MRISDWSSDVCSSDLGPPVEQSQFKRYIFLGGCFPGDVIVGITGDVNSAERKIRGGAIAEGCRTIGGIHVYIGQIEEAVAGFSNCIIPNKSVGGAQAKVGNGLLERFKKAFIGDTQGQYE